MDRAARRWMAQSGDELVPALVVRVPDERGWWICRIKTRMQDPGDGSVHQAHNITVLHYAGDMTFSYEEDAYNPASFGPMINAWTEAVAAHGGAAG